MIPFLQKILLFMVVIRLDQGLNFKLIVVSNPLHRVLSPTYPIVFLKLSNLNNRMAGKPTLQNHNNHNNKDHPGHAKRLVNLVNGTKSDLKTSPTQHGQRFDKKPRHKVWIVRASNKQRPIVLLNYKNDKWARVDSMTCLVHGKKPNSGRLDDVINGVTWLDRNASCSLLVWPIVSKIKNV
jgi:hypothetical protein